MGTGWWLGGCLCPCLPALALPPVPTFKEAVWSRGLPRALPPPQSLPCPFGQKTLCGPGFQSPTGKALRAQQSALWHFGGPSASLSHSVMLQIPAEHLACASPW